MQEPHIRINLPNQQVTNFLNLGVRNYYNQLNTTFNFITPEQLYYKGGELTYTSIFEKGLERFSAAEEYLTLREMSSKKNSGGVGVFDMAILYKNKTVFMIEGKWLWEKFDNPEKDPTWKPAAAKQYYENVRIQPNRYLEDIELFGSYISKVSIIIIFSVFRFDKDADYTGWKYEPQVENEFYAMKIYEGKEENFGFAVYGDYEER